jgi:hypothetical protein
VTTPTLCTGRSKECDHEFSRAKTAAVKANGKKAAGAVYAEHAMSLKRAGESAAAAAAAAAAANSDAIISPFTQRYATGNTGRAEELLVKAIAKDGQLSTA